jgi:hypothetical protein
VQSRLWSGLKCSVGFVLWFVNRLFDRFGLDQIFCRLFNHRLPWLVEFAKVKQWDMYRWNRSFARPLFSKIFIKSRKSCVHRLRYDLYGR